MAVQPMKAIAAVALTEGLPVQQILAAGITVSAVILVLGVTGLIDWLNRAIPKSVVRGLQLALGLALLMKGLQMVAGTHAWLAPDSYATGSRRGPRRAGAVLLVRRCPRPWCCSAPASAGRLAATRPCWGSSDVGWSLPALDAARPGPTSCRRFRGRRCRRSR